MMLPIRSVALIVCLLHCVAVAAAENELTPQQTADGWVLLFDGKSLAGWEPTSDADWKVVDGEIRASQGGQGFLMTTRQYADYELHVEFKAPTTTNSGVFLRTPLAPADPAKDCYELNIAPVDNPFPTASLVGRAKISTKPDGYTVKLPDGTSEFRRRGGPARTIDAWDGQWHAFDVALDGAAVRIALDGTLLATFIEAEPAANPTRGRIGLQFREGPVVFRNVRIREIKD